MPKSFLVKKTSRNKRKLEEDLCDEDEEVSDIIEGGANETSPESSATGDVAIQCNLESNANSHVPRAINGGNQQAPFTVLDTRGLHTLAELCLRHADYEFCTQNVNVDNRDTNKSEMRGSVLNNHDSFKEPRKVHEPRFKRRVSDSFANLREEHLKIETNEAAEEKCDDLKERKKQAVRRTTNVPEENRSSRLHKLEEELEKMLQGKEEIIGREIREFMENNKALEKELIEETGVSQTEITKYLEESVHLKEDKRKNLFRWYLEKKTQQNGIR